MEERQELRFEFDGVQSQAMVEIGATMFERVGLEWVGHILAPGALMRMPEIEIELPLAELYDGLDLTNPPDDEV